MVQPTLSVFLPNYNHARFLPEALRSLDQQTCRPQEVVIVDDGSTDDSVQIIEAFARGKPHVRFERHEVNRGVVYHEQQVLEQASGTYFHGLSADDRILPELYEKSLALLAEHPQAGFCSSLSYRIDEQGRNLGVYPTPRVSRQACYFSPAQVRQTLLEHGPWFMGNTAVWRREALLELGGTRPELEWFYDGFMSQLLALRYGVCFLPEPLGEFRQLDQQYSLESYDVRTAFPVYRRAIELMRTTYRDVFPQEYVDKFERQTLAYTMERSLAGSHQVHLAYMRSLLPKPRHRLLWGLLRLATSIQFLLAKVWLVVAVRREAWSFARRVVRRCLTFLWPWGGRRGNPDG